MMRHSLKATLRTVSTTSIMILAMAACTPRVEIAAPEKPIEINLNINIEHRVKVEIAKDVEKAMTDNPDLF